MEGWIKLYRQILDHPMWSSEPFTKGQAWIDLLLTANRSGEISTSATILAARWKWNRRKVYHYINRLEADNMIAHKTCTESAQNLHKIRTLQIYIIKWKDFQGEKGDLHKLRTTSAQNPHKDCTNNGNLPFYINKNIQEGENKNAHAREAAPSKSDIFRKLKEKYENEENGDNGDSGET